MKKLKKMVLRIPDSEKEKMIESDDVKDLFLWSINGSEVECYFPTGDKAYVLDASKTVPSRWLYESRDK